MPTQTDLQEANEDPLAWFVPIRPAARPALQIDVPVVECLSRLGVVGSTREYCGSHVKVRSIVAVWAELSDPHPISPVPLADADGFGTDGVIGNAPHVFRKWILRQENVKFTECSGIDPRIRDKCGHREMSQYCVIAQIIIGREI
jgi:hypothetical protein